MLKEIKTILGGEERALRFGTMEVLEHAGEIYPGDPMELIYGINTIELLQVAANKSGDPTQVISGIGNPKKLFTAIAAFAYAGLKCAGANVTTDQVIQWVKEADYETGSQILIEGRAGFTAKKSDAGEAEAQAQNNQEPVVDLPGSN